MSCTLDKMRELDIRLHVLPALLDRLFGHLALIVSHCEALPYSFPNRCRGLVGELINMAVFQRGRRLRSPDQRSRPA